MHSAGSGFRRAKEVKAEVEAEGGEIGLKGKEWKISIREKFGSSAKPSLPLRLILSSALKLEL